MAGKLIAILPRDTFTTYEICIYSIDALRSRLSWGDPMFEEG
ncbi:hypothetical protein [Candidatus Methanocrinis natronophilus]|uniref:Uncharacterized protein n=1 Tax=Candidatus Methanocrinis natronophilus TaxID=3033396 RepID=A0ABT5X5I9_9EURY|nr:hypothetical protein [Candidatus Methanocrinis natronophilus]MDF0589918.1 hypothetical protein [Candidatus Methanocrinis natronophilus]